MIRTICNFSFRGSNTLFCPLELLHTGAQNADKTLVHIIYIIHTFKFLKVKQKSSVFVLVLGVCVCVHVCTCTGPTNQWFDSFPTTDVSHSSSTATPEEHHAVQNTFPAIIYDLWNYTKDHPEVSVRHLPLRESHRLPGDLLLLCLGGGGIRLGGVLLRGDGRLLGLGRLLGEYDLPKQTELGPK